VADSARRMISAMSRREAQQKFTAVFVLVVLVVVTVLLIYYKS
jgi:competence protein ComGC